MSKYQELIDRMVEAKTNLDSYKKECRELADRILTALKNDMGWPENEFSLENPCMLDSEGRGEFSFKLTLGEISSTHKWTLSRERGSWKLDGTVIPRHITHLDLANFDAVIDRISDALVRDLSDRIDLLHHQNRWSSTSTG